MTRNRAILAATSAAVALLVAGCSNDTPAPPPASASTPTSSTPDDASPSPTPSESAVVVAPDRPAEMDDDGPAGAEAAATYFLELDDYIMKTGDTTEFKALSHKECSHCNARIDQSSEIAERGDRWEGGEIRAKVLHTYEQDAATGIWPIDMNVTVAPVSVTDSSGAEVFADPARVTESRVEVARRDGRWIVIEVREDQAK